VSRYFFARFDLMKWKDYGIMIWREKEYRADMVVIKRILDNE
jgi:hypothetical protein